MRLEVICKNRLGILREIVDIFVDYRVNLAKGEVGGDEGNAIYLYAPALLEVQYRPIARAIAAVADVQRVRRVRLMPSERRHFELDALLQSLTDPVMSVNRDGRIIAANLAAARALGLRIDAVPGLSLASRVQNLDLPALIRHHDARLHGLPVVIRDQRYLADVAPIHAEDGVAPLSLAGAVVTLHGADQLQTRAQGLARFQDEGFAAVLPFSRAMAALVAQAKVLATVEAPLLLWGEPGSGRERLARACHAASIHGGQGFALLQGAGLDAAALQRALRGDGQHLPGLLQGCRGGSLYLANVDELTPSAQAALLALLDDTDTWAGTRLLASSRRPLTDVPGFHPDLALRLQGLQLSVPPVRLCRDGLKAMAEAVLDRAARHAGVPLPRLTAAAHQKLADYHWPGNLRQLEQVLLQATALARGGEIRPALLHLPDGTPPPLPEPTPEDDWQTLSARFERQLLQQLYPDYPSARKLARRLGLSHTAVANKLRRYGLGSSGRQHD